jgi:hypothetical protein
MDFLVERSRTFKPNYELSEVKSFVDDFDPNAPQGFGIEISMRAGADRTNQSVRNSYIYAWCDPQLHVFYIGKGHGRRAWERTGHDRALRYAKRYHAGEYSVHLLREGLLDSEAQDLEEHAISAFGNALTNWVNLERDSVFSDEDRKAWWDRLSERPRAQDLERRFRDELNKTSDNAAKLQLLKSWVKTVREVELGWDAEDRRYAEKVAHISLFHRMRLDEGDCHCLALLPEVVDRFTKLLAKSNDFEAVVSVIDSLEKWHPRYFTTDYVDNSGEPRTRQFTKRELALIERREAARQARSK